MSWQRLETAAWEEPLTLAEQTAGDMALLYSALSEAHSGRYSFLFSRPLETREGSDWTSLPTSSVEELPDWVGYLGYGLREPKQAGERSALNFPDFRLTRYAHLIRFDHQKQCVEIFARRHPREGGDPRADNPGQGLQQFSPNRALSSTMDPRLRGDDSIADHALSSNFTRASYEAAVAKTVKAIEAGDFYQANLTRKFWGEFAAAPDAFALFQQLTRISPAPYSAFIRYGAQNILSSSPECLLSMGADGTITTRPIKGSARRSADAAEDKKLRAELAASAKNHAENLMIVDLMRNDLSRVCEAGSVKVAEQSGLYSYATIHHLISTIVGKKRADCSVSDVLAACFPAGSMTGAPKIAAMRWCESQENMERGVYSGAIGWFNATACDFSVVIRTLLIDSARFEFQVGGGIVADSTPEDEWRETLAKARGICAALGISEEAIAAL